MALGLYLLAFYNRAEQFLTSAFHTGSELLHATSNFLNGTSSEWYFLSSSFLPASVYPVGSVNKQEHIRWTFNTFHNTLVQTLTGDQPPPLKIKWLSTILHINDREYVLDDWLRNLSIVMNEEAHFSPELVVNMWSICNKVWPDYSDEVVLQIIDPDGELHTISVFDETDNEWDSLIPRQPEQEEDYEADTEGGDAEEEDDAEADTEEDEEAVEADTEEEVVEEEEEEATDVPVEQVVDVSVPVDQAVEAPVPVEQVVEVPVPVDQVVDVSVPVEQVVEAPAPVEQVVEAPVPVEQVVEVPVPAEQVVTQEEQVVPVSQPVDAILPPSPTNEEAATDTQ